MSLRELIVYTVYVADDSTCKSFTSMKSGVEFQLLKYLS
jgi:hypothetical protein